MTLSQIRPRRSLQLLLIGLSTLLISTYADAQQKVAPKTLTPQALVETAAGQIKNGGYQQAVATLNGLNVKQEGLDLARYYTLLGMAQTGLKNHGAAIGSFNLAIKSGQNDPLIYLYLAEIHYLLKDYKATLTAISKTGNNYKSYPTLLEMKAQSHWLLGQRAEAWETVSLAQELFPNETKYPERKFFYALDLGLYRQAAEFAQLYLSKSSTRAEDYVAIGNALRLNRQFEPAANILEIARLRYPEHTTIAKVLAHTYIDQGMHYSAANIMEAAARYHPEFVSEAAELYKNAGNFQRALRLNTQIADQPKKLKQRLGIFLGLKNYEMILNMESILARHRLLDDQNIRYALAYAAYTIGDFERARQHLTFVREPGLFKQATELQRLMQVCSAEKSTCS